MNSYLGAPLFILFFLALGAALSAEQRPEKGPATATRDARAPATEADSVEELQPEAAE